jgi:hypothetical protein
LIFRLFLRHNRLKVADRIMFDPPFIRVFSDQSHQCSSKLCGQKFGRISLSSVQPAAGMSRAVCKNRGNSSVSANHFIDWH